MIRRDSLSAGATRVISAIALFAASVIASAAGGWLDPRAVVSWDGSCGTTFWATVCNPGSHTNWNPDVMPSSSDTVSANALVTLFGGVGDASTVSFPIGLNITNGGQLRVNGAGGTIQNLALTNSSVNVVTEGASLEISGNSTSNGGMVYGNGALVNTGTLTGLSLMVRNLSNQPATFVNTLGGQTTLSTIPTEPGVSVVNANATLTLVPSSQTSGGAIASTGHGSFENTGTFITQHNGAAYSNFTIGCGMLQTDGEFIVQGASNATGTMLSGGALFSGGEILVNDNANLRFQTGVSGLYEFDGLSAINGNGNAFIQLGPFNGPDWRVLSDLNVNLTGTTGLMLDSGKLTLTGALTNAGNAWWKGMTIRKAACSGCSPKFVNSGSNFRIDTVTNGVVVLDAPFENTGTVTHAVGRFSLDNDALFTNSGEFQALTNEIGRENAAYVNPFVNTGTFIKPDLPSTQDSVVSAVFRNETGGEIKVDKSMLSFYGDSLRLAGGDITLAAPGVLRLTNGDSVAEPGTTTTITGTGKMIVDLFGAAGYLIAESDAVATSSLAGAQGGLWLKVGGHMGGPGLFINTGEFHWDDGSIGINGAGEFWNQAQTIISHGSDIGGPTASFVNDVGATVIQEPGNLTVDSGAGIHNRGMWHMSIADAVNTSISDSTGAFINYGQGTVEVEFVSGNPGTSDADFTVGFQNFGTFHAKNSAVCFISNSLDVVDGNLLRGTWIVDPFAQIYFQGYLIDSVGSSSGQTGSVVVTGSSFGFPDFDIRDNYGTVNATGSLNSNGSISNHGNLNASPGPITTPGQINNGDPSGSTTILKYVNEYTVPGLTDGAGPSGFICAAFNNYANGVIRPGGPAAPGAFTIDGNLNQFNGGIIDIDLGGALPVDQHDQVHVDGNVALDGILRVRVLPGFTPTAGQQFTIITASNGTITGTFDQIMGPGQYALSYLPGSVKLTVVTAPVVGDANGDGHVNVSDLLAVIIAWGACPLPPVACPADVNGDGQVNVGDLLTVIVNWG